MGGMFLLCGKQMTQRWTERGWWTEGVGGQ